MKHLLVTIVFLSLFSLIYPQTNPLYLPVDSLFRTETPTTSSNDMLYELGSEFQALSNGFITKARLFSLINEGGDHTIRLWGFNGSAYTLIAGPYTWNFPTGVYGWRDYTFPTPIEVQENNTYIISITNSSDLNYARSQYFESTTSGSYVSYIRGVYTTVPGSVPANSYANSCYFRDIVFSLSTTNGNLNAGSIGVPQSLCYNTVPAPLTQITVPSGGTGTYTFQWQSSPDNSVWTDITGATLPDYAPTALLSSTYFRRTVASGSYFPVNSSPVLITISNTIAQLHDNISIVTNTSTLFNITVSGGVPPYTINYTRNNISQSTIYNYLSGTNISTGVLTTGIYSYVLTSVTDANGCAAQSLGSNITITVTENSGYLYFPVDSLFRTETPLSFSNDRLYELGTEFRTLSDGFITKARLFSQVNEGGNHVVRLWEFNGSSYTLIAGPYTWSFSTGVTGWRDYTLPSPVAVDANTTYIISITNSSDLNYSRTQSFQSSTLGSYVTYTRGVYGTVPGETPTSSYLSSCYFRDVVFSIFNANGNLSAGSIGSPQSICYNSAPVALTQVTPPSGGTGTYTYQWQSSADNSIWSNIPGANLQDYAPLVLSSSTYFRRAVTSGTYLPVYTTPVLITVYSNLTPGSIGNAQSVCYNSAPAQLTQINAPAGGTGTYTYQWQSSPDNSTWSDIPGGTSAGYNPPALTSNTYYRRNITSGSCGTVNSNSILITVYATLTPGSVGTAQTICYNTAPASFTQLTAPTGGTGTYTYRWQTSPDNTTWSDIPGATAANYSPSALTSNTYYRRNVTSGTCGTVISNSILITVYATLTPGTVGTAQTICYNTAPAALTQLTAPTGGTGTYTYQWQSSPDNNTWSNITGASSAGYNPPALLLNTYYRRNVTNGTCGTVNSNSILITVSPQFTLAQLHDNTSIGNNTSTNFNIAIAGGTSPFTIDYARNGVSQTTINNYTSGTNISTGILTTGVYVYALTSVTDATGCAPQNLGTNITVTVTENGNLTPGSIGSAQSLCYNTAPSPLTQLTAPTGGTGTYTYQWQNSPDNSLWTNISGATLSDYAPPALSSSTYFRRTVSSGSYNPVHSNSLLITIYATLTPGSIGTAQSICYNTVPVTLTQLTAPAGGTGTFTYQWQRSPDNSTWSDLPGATATDYSPSSLSSNTYYRRNITGGTCGTVNSNSILITVSPQVTLAQLHDDVSIENNTSTNFNIAITGGTSPFTINYARNGISQTTINNYTSGADISTGVLTTGVYIYTLTSVTDATGCTPQNLGTNITVTVTENGNLTPGSIGSAQSLCYNTAPSPLTQLTAPTGGTGTYTYQWQNSPDNSLWTNISGATLSDYAPPALSSSTYFRRTVSSGSYNPVYSNSLLITVYAILTPGSIGTAQTICYNSAPAALIQVTAPAGGTGTFTYQWQRSPDNSTWSDLPGATATDYSPSSLSSNTYYRRNITGGTCGTVNSNSILITVSPQVTLAQLHDDVSIENNTSTNFNIAIAGGTSPFTIDYARNGVSQTTINNYTSGTNISTGILTTGVYVYALTTVTDATGCAPQNLGTNITVTVTENGNLTSGSIGSAQSLCYNTAPSPLTQLTAPTGGTGTYTYQWQSSPDNSLWTNISGATLSDYAPPALSSSTYFRRNVSSGSYNPVYSNSLLITVYAILTPGSIGTAQTICYNSAPAALIQVTAPAGGTGTFTYQWQSSPDNSTWSDLPGATATNYNPSALTTNTYYRRIVTSGSCGTVYSTSLLITVSPQITLAQLHDDVSIENNTSTNFNIAITGGTSPFTIDYARNGVSQTTINNYTSGTNISTGILTTGVYVYALTSVTDATGCVAQNLGSNITVTVTESSGSLYLPVDSLFRTEVPSSSSNDRLYELGTEFQALSNGFITKARLFSLINEGGNHTIRLWGFNGSTYILMAGPYTWNFPTGVYGWRDYTFPTPIEVDENNTYIISITNSSDLNYARSQYFESTISGSYLSYIRGVYTAVLGTAPINSYVNSCYFRDVVISLSNSNGNLAPGTIGSSQTICYNSTPSSIIQVTPPTGGTGNYTYQWQSSPDNSVWANIAGATLPDYTPIALLSSTYYRRTVNSGSYFPVNSSPVLITVSNTTAQLHDNISIFSNSSTYFNITVSGGISPYTINYTLNNITQSTIYNYTSGSNISTGNLTTGIYSYALTSVTDANGCAAQSLGSNITINVAENSGNLYLPVDSLFRTETPTSESNDSPYELGSEFQVLSDGFITKARLFSHINEGGAHTIRLWRFNGSSYVLIGGPFIWNFQSGISGWRDYTLPSPIAVQGNNIYIISITNSPDLNYMRNQTFQSSTVGSYIEYIRGVYSAVPGQAPTSTYLTSCYFRDVVFSLFNPNGNLTSGSIGTAQTICNNNIPSALTQITAPTGGTGTYSFQWQSSSNNLNWTDIPGATLSTYAPPSLLLSTYFRRTVTSGSYTPVHSIPVLITVSNVLAQLHYNSTIYTNSSTYFYIDISEGTPPFTVSYNRNGVPQMIINNYSSGAGISTGVLTTGLYNYTLTSVIDANGCSAQNLGTNIIITVTEDQGITINSNKALILVNSVSLYYPDYVDFIKPYLDNFGIPYDVVNVNIDILPEFNDYAIIIFGHRDVYVTGYPITQLETAISNGVGLYSFDPHLFDFSSGFSTPISVRSVNSNQINIPNTTHFITQYHAPDTYSPANNTINLLDYWSISQNSSLNNGIDLATMSFDSQIISLLQVSNYGTGRIVKWSGYHWVHDNILGPIYGMDDLLWRGIVWAARKPFVMQGLPPMITMRVDDVSGGAVDDQMGNFEWLRIANEFGFIPWVGTFNSELLLSSIPVLRNLINNNLVTASPHAFSNDQFIYFNNENLPLFDAAENVRDARNFYTQNGLTMSRYMVPHTYGISSEALSEVRAMGIEFIGIQMLPDNFYFGGIPWINCGPYRINRDGIASAIHPVYYGGNVSLNGIDFFNCLTEIRDDGGYEWYPNNDIITSASRGIRHLRRSLNSMVLSSLFTHEYFLEPMDSANWREILYQITSSISEYNPEYTSTDYAVQYIRAKNNIRITNVRETISSIEITYSGNNDMDTKCYLFTEQNGQITYRFTELPQINGSHTISIIK